MESSVPDSDSSTTPSSSWKNAALVCVSVLLAMLVALVLDRTAASTLLKNKNVHALVFEPYAQQIYESSEFTVVAKINSLGFRDRQIDAQLRPEYRIVALGDSFTFGYGVADDEPWPKVLERLLWDAGLDVEVLNLGRPGAGPRTYAAIAEVAIPVLKPDLVLIGLLQGDDLYHNYPGPLAVTDRPANQHKTGLLRLAHSVYPNFVGLIEARGREPQSPPGPEDFAERRRWRQDRAEQFATSWSDEARERFDTLDDELRRLFFSGDINPHNIKMGINGWDSYVFSVRDDPDSRALQQEKATLCSEALLEIRLLAEEYGGNAATVIVPHFAYMTPETQAQAARIGLQCTPEMINSPRSVQLLGLACDAAGMDWHSSVDLFRNAVRGQELFFPLDLHFNAEGHRAFAELVTPFVRSRLSKTDGAVDGQ